MKIAVQHRLVALDMDAHERALDDAILLPVRSCEAQMGMTVEQILRVAGWRFDLPTVVRINGEYLARHEWSGTHVSANDNVEFLSRPLGGGGGSTLGMVAAVAGLLALTVLAPWAGAAIFGAGTIGAGIFSAAVLAGGGAAISWFMRPKAAAKGEARNELYSFAFQGNTARPGQPIPEWFGRCRAAPPFAAPRYSEFDGDNMTEHALYALTVGEIDVEEIQIGDTPVWTKASGVSPDFPGVKVEIVPPGSDVTLFPVNVQTNSEVTGNQFTGTNTIGPFAANAAGTQAREIILDFVWPSGSYVQRQQDSKLFAPQTGLEVQYRAIDDGGNPVAPGTWTTWTKTYQQLRQSQIRVTERITVPPARYQVKARRTNAPISEGMAAGLSGTDDVTWTALRTHIAGPQSFPAVQTLALQVKAGAAMQGFSGNVQVVGTRILPVWNGSGFSPAPTRNIAWAALRGWDMCGLSRDRVNLANFLEHATAWTAEGWTFDFVYQNGMQLDEFLEDVLRAGRAFPAFVGDTVEIVREEPRGVPAVLFTDNDIRKGTLEVEYVFADETFADGMVGQYIDETTFRLAEVPSAPEGEILANPSRVELRGVSKRPQAADLIRFMAGDHQYRRATVRWQARAEGLLLRRGDLVTVSSEEPDTWGATAGVLAYDTGTRVLTFDRALPWDSGASAHYIELRARDGRPWGPVRITRGTSDFTGTLVLADIAPETARQSGRTWIQALTRQDTEEHPSIAFSPAQPRTYPVLVVSGEPLSDGEHIQLTGVLDAPEVYAYTLDGVPPLPVTTAVYTPRLPQTTEAPTLSVFQRRAELIAASAIRPMPGAVVYEAELTFDAQASWQRVWRDPRTSFEVPILASDAVRARWRGVNSQGLAGPWYISPAVTPPAIALTNEFFDSATWTIDDLEAELQSRLSLDPVTPGSLGRALDDAAAAVQRGDDLLAALSPDLSTQARSGEPQARSVQTSIRMLAQTVSDLQARLEIIHDGAIAAGMRFSMSGGQAYIEGVAETQGRINQVRIDLDATNARVSLLAASAIAGDLGPILASISSIEVSLDALEATLALTARQATIDTLVGAGPYTTVTDLSLRMNAAEGNIALRSTTADFTALESRVDAAELTLSAANLSFQVEAFRALNLGANTQAQTLAGIMDRLDTLQDSQAQELGFVRQGFSATLNSQGETLARATFELAALQGHTYAAISRIDTAAASEASARASSDATLTASIATSNGRISSLETIVVTPTTGLASRVGAIEVSLGTPGSGGTTVTGRLTTLENVTLTATTGLVSRVGVLETTLGSGTGGTTVTGRLATLETLLTTPGGTTGDRFTTLEGAVNDGATGLSATRARVATVEGIVTTPGGATGSRVTAIEATATGAATAAATANTAAGNAAAAAGNAQTTANTASAAAAAAQTTANTATGRVATLESIVTTPGQAIGTRVTAIETSASTANTAAGNAATAAAGAQTTANNAAAAAAAAQTTANNAQARVGTVETAITNPGQAVGSRVTSIETSATAANTAAAAANTAAGNASTAAAAAQATATNAQTRVSTVETAITTPGQAVGTRVTAIETTAGNAATAAAAANTAAGNASTAAAGAQTTANNASTAAGAAQTTANSAVARVGTVETAITTPGQAIGSRITTVEARANAGSASGAIGFFAEAAPSGGYTAAYYAKVTALAARTGLALLARGDGTSEILLEAGKLRVQDPGVAGGVPQGILSATAGVFRIGSAVVKIDGDAVVGVVRSVALSSDGVNPVTRLDLDNGRLEVYD